MDRDALISALTHAAENDHRVVALLLTGSLGAGHGDAWSDVDTLFVVRPEAHAGFVADLHAWVAAAAGTDPVLWRQLYPPHPLFHCVLPGVLRLDLTVTTPEHVAAWRSLSKALYDPRQIHAALIEAPPKRTPDAIRISQIIEEFLRILAMGPVAQGRSDFVTAASGCFLMRGLLQDLLIEAQAPPTQPGALAIARLLPHEDLSLLVGLPPLAANADSVCAFTVAVASAFLPRARELAGATGAAWPTALESEARAALAKELGLALPI